MEPKPGIKTTEFWIALIVIIVANVFMFASPSIAEKFPENETLQTIFVLGGVIAGALANVLIGLGWIVKRSHVKSDHAAADVMKKNGNGGFAHPLALLILGLLALAFLTMSSGCTVQDSWIKANEATYQAVVPEFMDYVNADPKLDKDQKRRRKITCDAWWRDIQKWKE